MKAVTVNLLTTLLLGILFSLTIDWSEPTLAQTPETQRQFVYGAKIFNGLDYDSKLYCRKFYEVRTYQHKRALVLTARKAVRLIFALLHTGQQTCLKEEIIA